MALTGTLVAASATFTQGGVALRYAVEVYDDQLGYVGAKGYEVTDAQVQAAVLGYVTQMMSVVESHVGIPVSLPAPPAPEPAPEP